MAAQRRARLLADDGQHGHVIHPRVVQAGDKVRRARAGGGDTDTQFTGELGMRRPMNAAISSCLA